MSDTEKVDSASKTEAPKQAAKAQVPSKAKRTPKPIDNASAGKVSTPVAKMAKILVDTRQMLANLTLPGGSDNSIAVSVNLAKLRDEVTAYRNSTKGTKQVLCWAIARAIEAKYGDNSDKNRYGIVAAMLAQHITCASDIQGEDVKYLKGSVSELRSSYYSCAMGRVKRKDRIGYTKWARDLTTGDYAPAYAVATKLADKAIALCLRERKFAAPSK